jgi:hypothetical protein
MIPFSFATSVMCDVARPGWFVINHERDSEPNDALYHVVVPCFFPIDWSADSRSFGAKANEGLIGRPQSAGRAFAWPAATLGTLRRTRTREPRRPSRAAMLGPCPIRPSRPNPKLQRSINRQPEGCTCPPSPLLPMSSRATRLPFSFGCHSLAWRPRCSLRGRCRSQVGHRRCCCRGHPHASPCIRGRADTARGGTSCRPTAAGISGCLFRTNAGSDLLNHRSPGPGAAVLHRARGQ